MRKEAAQRPEAGAEALNDCAWSLLECPVEDLRDPSTALVLARRAISLSGEKDPAILDTPALALFRTGDVAAAVETQRRAVALLPGAAPDSPEGAAVAEMEARLREFEAAEREGQ